MIVDYLSGFEELEIYYFVELTTMLDLKGLSCGGEDILIIPVLLNYADFFICEAVPLSVNATCIVFSYGV